MKVVATRQDLRAALTGCDDIGFVPTMGFLHAGHGALIERARAESGTVVVSLFVNPTQFAPTEDLAAYPRDIERDTELVRSLGGDILWIPGLEDIYPPGFSSRVVVDGPTKVLEGERRPTHFAGVTTVVSILFHLVQPQRAYFGQKDAQQCAVISAMVNDLGMPVEIVEVPTVRDADGLALSSRNTYLSQQERAAAPVLHCALSACQRAWLEAAEPLSGQALRTLVTDMIASEPLADIDYVSCARLDDLTEVDDIVHGVPLLVSLAVRFGRTRLIDNVRLPAR